MQQVHVATYNIHKGFSQFNRRLAVHDLRAQLRQLDPDVLFLQEVQGEHQLHASRHIDWPGLPQHEYLAGGDWHHAYGRNVVYDHGHHGNAILSRFPIQNSRHQDVTTLRFERRGLLHSTLAIPDWPEPLHCVCVHLSLNQRCRSRQVRMIAEGISAQVPATSPLIIAGDFNDWRNRAGEELARLLGVVEAFGGHDGPPARSFPSSRPLLRLDRVYLRGLKVHSRQVLAGEPWSRISDHAALSVHLALAG